MTRLRSTIRRKLITAMMLTSIIVLVLTGAVLVVYDVVSFRGSLVRALDTRGRIIAANVTAALAFQNSSDAQQTLGALRSDPGMLAAALYDREGDLFAAYPEEAKAPPLPARPDVGGYRFEKSSLVLYLPVLEDRRWLGTLCLRSGLESLEARLQLDIVVVLVAIVGSVGVALALSTWLQRGITRPIRALAEAARTVSERKDYSIRADVVSDDELGLLTTGFNSMLVEIQRRDADLERRVAARTADLEASNRELEAFSYSVSHDLRAPVRHIDGFTDLLRRHAGASLDEKGQRYLAQIADSSHSMGHLIDDLLVFSRMGRVEMRTTRVDLDALVAEVREAHATETAGRNIEWRVTPLPTVEGDPAMLRVVFTNLIANAIKYTSTRDAAVIEIGARPTRDGDVIVVRDNGVGFDMAYVHKLFGVFQRLHSADEFEGTGIGLANVRRVVERHGGTVRAEGELDRGATFYVTLPSAEDASHVAGGRQAA